MTWDTSDSACECSDSDAYWDATLTNCEIHCSPAYYSGSRTWDPTANSGAGDCTCASGYAWDAVNVDCDDVCDLTDGETWNGSACECATTGEAWSGTECVDECTLKTGSTWDASASPPACECDSSDVTSA